MDMTQEPAAAVLQLGYAEAAVLAVQREMDRETPDFDFLIAINENIAAGLSG